MVSSWHIFNSGTKTAKFINNSSCSKAKMKYKQVLSMHREVKTSTLGDFHAT